MELELFTEVYHSTNFFLHLPYIQ